MLFTSFEFIFIFVPLAIFCFFSIKKLGLPYSSEIVLIAFSLYFYAYHDAENLILISFSIFINYCTGKALSTSKIWYNNPLYIKKILLVAGIVFNLTLLGYYKYSVFIIENINTISNYQFPTTDIALPLAISFFTFQQIAFLRDSYKSYTREYSFIRYILFVTFFPQLIAGPIVHHQEMMPQFKDIQKNSFSWENQHKGLTIFIIGLFKKVVVADTFAKWATAGHAATEHLHFFNAWGTSLAYTTQIYFDFSGYADMAIGIALLFNIILPDNFNSPYSSLNIQDFWRRWHITLSRFLRDYIYIPLGGNKKGVLKTYINLFTVFFIGGIWHGAGWTFIIWGALHGIAICIHRWWSGLGRKLPKAMAGGLTFLFVNITWIFFRANSIEDGVNILKAMIGLNGVFVYKTFSWAKALGCHVTSAPLSISVMMVLLYFYVIQDIFYKNSKEWAERVRAQWGWSILLSILFATSLFTQLQADQISEFLYWQF